MLEWAEHLRLADTRGALERLSGRSEVELLPAMLMLLELAERVEANEPEALPEPPIVPPPPIAEIEREVEPPPPVESVHDADDVPIASADADDEPTAPADADQSSDTADAEAEGLPGPVLHAASSGDNMEFRSDRFGASSLAPPDDESDVQDDEAATARDLTDEPAAMPLGPDGLVIVPGHVLPEEQSAAPQASGDAASPTERAAGEGRPPENATEDRTADGPGGSGAAPTRRAVLQSEPPPHRRTSPPRRSPIGSVLLPSQPEEESSETWKIRLGVAGAIVILILIWLALGLPPFGGNEPDVGPTTLDSGPGGGAAAMDVRDEPSGESGTPSADGGEAGLPAALEPNPLLAVGPLPVREARVLLSRLGEGRAAIDSG
jgi:hypothetical protein